MTTQQVQDKDAQKQATDVLVDALNEHSDEIQKVHEAGGDVKEALRNALGPSVSEEELDALVKKIEENNEPIDEAKDIRFLNKTFLEICQQEPFLGTISMKITKIADHKMPTAYIGIRPNGNSQEIIMGFNPKFMEPLSEKQRMGVVKHELYHFIFQHIFSRSVGDRNFQTMWNWATDLAINSIIGKENLPDMCLLPGKPPIDPKTGQPVPGQYAEYIGNAPVLQSSDHYFEALKKIYEENDDGKGDAQIGFGMGTMDDHSVWDDLDEDVQEEIRNKARELMGDAAMEAQRSNSWGSVPQEIQAVINRILSREIDWRSILRNFIGRTRTVERHSSIKKINKKLPYIQPGVKRPFKANFACFIDQSGSMSDRDISMLFGELESFSKETTLDVYHFDTQIDEKSHTVWKKGSPTPPPHRTRCGGTDFNAVANFCNNKENRGRWSGVVILTDGYAPTMGNIVGSKVLWVITEHGTMETVRPGDLACQMKQQKQFKRY